LRNKSIDFQSSSASSERVDGLRNSSPHEWWRETKKLTGQSSKPELLLIINSVASGDTQLLVSLVSVSSLQQVSMTPLPAVYSVETKDVGLLCQYVVQLIEVLDKLSRIKVH